jgi:hypothetical protein
MAQHLAVRHRGVSPAGRALRRVLGVTQVAVFDRDDGQVVAGDPAHDDLARFEDHEDCLSQDDPVGALGFDGVGLDGLRREAGLGLVGDVEDQGRLQV